MPMRYNMKLEKFAITSFVKTTNRHRAKTLSCTAAWHKAVVLQNDVVRKAVVRKRRRAQSRRAQSPSCAPINVARTHRAGWMRVTRLSVAHERLKCPSANVAGLTARGERNSFAFALPFVQARARLTTRPRARARATAFADRTSPAA
jgi:hypothetical protein